MSIIERRKGNAEMGHGAWRKGRQVQLATGEIVRIIDDGEYVSSDSFGLWHYQVKHADGHTSTVVPMVGDKLVNQSPIMQLVLICFLAISTSACNSVDRLINGREEKKPEPVQVWSSIPDLGDAPEFGLPIPAGTTRTVFHGRMPTDGIVLVNASPGSTVQVFMKDLSVNRWFRLYTSYSDAFYYTYDAVTGQVRYIGKHLSAKDYCVYQYEAL